MSSKINKSKIIAILFAALGLFVPASAGLFAQDTPIVDGADVKEANKARRPFNEGRRTYEELVVDLADERQRSDREHQRYEREIEKLEKEVDHSRRQEDRLKNELKQSDRVIREARERIGAEQEVREKEQYSIAEKIRRLEFRAYWNRSDAIQGAIAGGLLTAVGGSVLGVGIYFESALLGIVGGGLLVLAIAFLATAISSAAKALVQKEAVEMFSQR